MSEVPGGPDWWQASDGKWYRPELRPPPLPPPSVPQPSGPPPGPAPVGYPYYQYAPAQAVNGLAIASLVLGILWVYWVGSILALVFGYMALKQIRERSETGRGMAIAGVVLGWIGVATGVLLIVAVIIAVAASHNNSQSIADLI